jgi:hypothetical protein
MTTPGHNSARIKRRCLAASAALTCLGLALAQSVPPGEIHSRTVAYLPPSGVTLRAEVRVVEVPVVIRDAYLHAVAGLKRDDFEIYDDGKQRPSRPSQHSIRLGLNPLSMPMRAQREKMRRAPASWRCASMICIFFPVY